MGLFWSRFFAFAEDDEVLLYMTGTSPRTVRSDLPNGWSSKGTQAQSGIIYRYGNDGWLNWPFRRHLPFAWDRRRNGNEITFSITCRKGRNRPWGAREREVSRGPSSPSRWDHNWPLALRGPTRRIGSLACSKKVDRTGFNKLKGDKCEYISAFVWWDPNKKWFDDDYNDGKTTLTTRNFTTIFGAVGWAEGRDRATLEVPKTFWVQCCTALLQRVRFWGSLIRNITRWFFRTGGFMMGDLLLGVVKSGRS